ncbi:MAG: DUF1080 domain-containing protein [Caulobacter sp.]|nr:DUF1080 domain-containing protein [Caulobacter sp.]
MIHRRDLMLGLAATSLAGPALAADGFTPLFNGHDLTGWTTVGDANWSVHDGALVADKGAMSFLVSDGVYRDFDLRVEIWISPEANSGVFIRCSDRQTFNPANAYEVNVFDARPDPTYGTGAIVDVARVSPMPHAAGRWSLLEISARGDAFTVVLNGQKTVDSVHDSALAEGPIALQYGSGVVKFRKVDVRPL